MKNEATEGKDLVLTGTPEAKAINAADVARWLREAAKRGDFDAYDEEFECEGCSYDVSANGDDLASRVADIVERHAKDSVEQTSYQLHLDLKKAHPWAEWSVNSDLVSGVILMEGGERVDVEARWLHGYVRATVSRGVYGAGALAMSATNRPSAVFRALRSALDDRTRQINKARRIHKAMGGGDSRGFARASYDALDVARMALAGAGLAAKEEASNESE